MRKVVRVLFILLTLLLVATSAGAASDCRIVGFAYCGRLCLDYYLEGTCMYIDDPSSACVYLSGGCASIRDSPCCTGGSLF